LREHEAQYSSDDVEDSLRPEAVSPLFRGRFGHPYIYRPSCPSTQELVRGLGEGAVASCEQQTAGRGRMGREWISPWGAGVLFSLALEPRTPPERLPAFGLVVAEAVCEACWPDAQVRWPNDVVVGGRKLAGVLAELREGRLVVGVGVNANHRPDQLPPGARVPGTSLRILRGAPVDRAQLLADIVASVEARYTGFERYGFTGLERDELRGRRVELAGGAAGLCTGVDEQGRLVVDGHPHTSAEVTAVLVAEDGGDYHAVEAEAECQDGF
jgi:BirA family transcriptional regulator, biotin operon repressor / biotin---[acetyl-CoA-carboxylase] ligase